MSNVYNDGLASNSITIGDFVQVARTAMEQVAAKSGEDVSHLETDQLLFIPEESVREHPDFAPYLSDEASVHMSFLLKTPEGEDYKRFMTVHFPPGSVLFRAFPGLFAVVTVKAKQDQQEKIH